MNTEQIESKVQEYWNAISIKFQEKRWLYNDRESCEEELAKNFTFEKLAELELRVEALESPNHKI